MKILRIAVGIMLISISLAGCSEQTAVKANKEQVNSSNQDKPVSEREETFFINSDDGWKAEYQFYGMFREDMILYHTNDAGAHWEEIANSKDMNSTLPNGVKSGIVFVNAERGWITTNAPWEGTIGLFTTNDGGYTWNEQQLELPNILANSIFNTFPPLFVSAEVGILVAVPEKEHSLIYLTNNIGKSWIPVLDEPEGGMFELYWSKLHDGAYKVISEGETWVLNIVPGGKWVKN